MPSPWRRRSRMQGTMDWHRRRASSSSCRSGTTWRKTSSMKMNRSRSSFRSVEDLYRVLTHKGYSTLLTYLIIVAVYAGTCTVRNSLLKTSLICKSLRYVLLLKNCCSTVPHLNYHRIFWEVMWIINPELAKIHQATKIIKNRKLDFSWYQSQETW